MGCGACWDETCREKADVVRGGWADVARRLPAKSSVLVSEELDHDGTKTLVKQYWEAACGCKVEITLVIPDTPDKPN
jgi:hypothetical protein